MDSHIKTSLQAGNVEWNNMPMVACYDIDGCLASIPMCTSKCKHSYFGDRFTQINKPWLNVGFKSF